MTAERGRQFAVWVRTAWRDLRIWLMTAGSWQGQVAMTAFAARHVWRRLTRSVGRPVLITTGGLRFFVRPGTSDINALQEVVMDGCYWPSVDWLPRAGAVVVDVGANIGAFSLAAGEIVGATGRIESFEPVPANVLLLRRNMELNGLEAAVEIHEAAAWRTPGRGTVMTANGKSAAVEATVREDAGGSVLLVPLDEVIGYASRVDLLKVDVEGAEVDVLEGCPEMLRRTERAVIECHSTALENAVVAIMMIYDLAPSWRRITLGDIAVVGFERVRPSMGPTTPLSGRGQEGPTEVRRPV